MLVSSYVLPRPDLPARFESLNDDTLTTILQFVGKKSYRSFGGTNKHCKEIYLSTQGMTKETFLYGYAPLSAIIDRIERAGEFNWKLRVGKGVIRYNRSDVMKWALEERKSLLLEGICAIASKEGRIDLLDEVWNNNIDGDERGLELDGQLYEWAIQGGNLHVMKWLSEQACPWGENNFRSAAKEGNLDVLQWLHDEGCPWHRRYRVSEDEIEPGVIEWLRTNGYGDRILSHDFDIIIDQFITELGRL